MCNRSHIARTIVIAVATAIAGGVAGFLVAIENGQNQRGSAESHLVSRKTLTASIWSTDFSANAFQMCAESLHRSEAPVIYYWAQQTLFEFRNDTVLSDVPIVKTRVSANCIATLSGTSKEITLSISPLNAPQ